MLPLTRITLTESDISAYNSVIPAKIVIASRTASKIIEDAQKTAQSIIEAAERTYKEKQKEGYQTGLAKWETEKAHQVTQLNLNIKEHLTQLQEKIESHVLQITQKVIGSMEKSEVLTGLVSQVINQLTKECTLNLRVSPENSEVANQVVKTLLKNDSSIEGFNVLIDPRLSDADCLLEHPEGTYDISVDTQINKLADNIQAK